MANDYKFKLCLFVNPLDLKDDSLSTNRMHIHRCVGHRQILERSEFACSNRQSRYHCKYRIIWKLRLTTKMDLSTL